MKEIKLTVLGKPVPLSRTSVEQSAAAHHLSAEPFLCPRCGSTYPMAGRCQGRGDDRHPAERCIAI